MSVYSSSTVSKLKEILKSKGLSTTGVKSELIARLEAADSKAPVVVEENVEEEKTAPEKPADAPSSTTEEPVASNESVIVETEKDESAVETAAETSAKPETKKEEKIEKEQPKEMSADERKSKAIELLKAKLKRAEKFGTDTEDIKRQLKRVERFGVELGTELAIAIGASKPSKPTVVNKNNRVYKNNRNKNHRHNRR